MKIKAEDTAALIIDFQEKLVQIMMKLLQRQLFLRQG